VESDPVSTLQFYEALASGYHLIYADWQQSVRWHGEVLDRIIHASLGRRPASLLDCTCGIGTQAIGLALRGYNVYASDLSPAAVERARREATSFGVSMTFGVADLRKLATQVPGSFEVVIACDNSLPHLLSDEDLQEAIHNIHSKLESPGLFLASLRDYDQLQAEQPRSNLPRVYDDNKGRRIVFQVWDWAEDGRTYMVHQFLLREEKDGWQTNHYATHYRALLRRELSRFLREADFSQIEWLMPADSSYFQPIVKACKR